MISSMRACEPSSMTYMPSFLYIILCLRSFTTSYGMFTHNHVVQDLMRDVHDLMHCKIVHILMGDVHIS